MTIGLAYVFLLSPSMIITVMDFVFIIPVLKYLLLYPLHAGVGKSNFTLVSMPNTEFILILLFINIELFICITTVNLVLSTAV